MIDKIVIQAVIAYKRDAVALAERNSLQRCTKGGVEYYESSEYGNLVGMNMQIKGNRAKVECSLHKLHNKWLGGALDNSGLFSIDEARATLCILLERTGLSVFPVYVTYYEIGLSIPMSDEAYKYIALVSGIGAGAGRILLEDAHFEELRQKTTRKTKDIKKFYKIYDKTFEAMNRYRRRVPPNILRIETVYRRQKIPLREFVGAPYMNKIAGCFFRDWGGIQFPKVVTVVSGVRASRMQAEWAAVIMTLGEKAFMKQTEYQYEMGDITAKQLRTRREFVRSWKCIKSRFTEVTVNKGVEYLEALHKLQSIVISG